MIRFPHLSFDLWMTLIRSNPRFKLEKINLLHSKYNPQSKSIDEVKTILRKIDVNSTRLTEITGRNIDPLIMWGMILLEMGYDEEFVLKEEILVELNSKIQQLCLDYMPIPYDENTVKELEKLYKITDLMTIASNTGFISGVTMRKVLKEIGILKFFRGEVFSDECGFAKPSGLFFEKVKKLSPYGSFGQKWIMHIGDNVNADIIGAELAGIQSYQINSNDCKITDIYGFLKS